MEPFEIVMTIINTLAVVAIPIVSVLFTELSYNGAWEERALLPKLMFENQ